MRYLFVAFLTSVGVVANAQNIVLNGAEVNKFALDMMLSVTPSYPENAYFPPFLKEKLSYVQRGMNSGQIAVSVTSEPFNPKTSSLALMETTRGSDGRPTIIIYATRLWYLVKIQGNMTSTPEMYKNTFALGLAHEAVHLETGPINRDFEAQVREEMRTWRKVDLLMVRPLRKAGHPLDSDFIRVDDLLLKCHDSENCPALRRELIGEGKISKSRTARK